MLAGISKTILIKLNGETTFYTVINLAVKRARLESKLNIWRKKEIRKYPPRINEF